MAKKGVKKRKQFINALFILIFYNLNKILIFNL